MGEITDEVIILDDEVIEVRRLKTPDEYGKLVRAQMDVWKSDECDAVPQHLLIAADRRGGLVLGAFNKVTGELIGFVFGFPAISSNGKVYHYSHITGVLSKYRFKGLGYVLKLKQREYVLNQGLDLIAWTYDPLQAPNAKFNVSKLGVIVRRFYEDYYGVLNDSINKGMPTDRFEAEWWIKSTLVRLRLSKLLRQPSIDEILRIGGKLITRTEIIGSLVKLSDYDLHCNAEIILIEIPRDLSELRVFNDFLSRWRYGLRKVFNHYVNNEGYIVSDFIVTDVDGFRRNFYILWRGELERVLNGELPWSYVR